MITRLCEYEIISVNTYNCLTLPQIRLYAHSFVNEYTIYLNQKKKMKMKKNLLVCVYKLCKEYVFVEKKPEKLKTNKKRQKRIISLHIYVHIYVFICVHIIHK